MRHISVNLGNVVLIGTLGLAFWVGFSALIKWLGPRNVPLFSSLSKGIQSTVAHSVPAAA